VSGVRVPPPASAICSDFVPSPRQSLVQAETVSACPEFDRCPTNLNRGPGRRQVCPPPGPPAASSIRAPDEFRLRGRSHRRRTVAARKSTLDPWHLEGTRQPAANHREALGVAAGAGLTSGYTSPRRRGPVDPPPLARLCPGQSPASRQRPCALLGSNSHARTRPRRPPRQRGLAAVEQAPDRSHAAPIVATQQSGVDPSDRESTSHAGRRRLPEPGALHPRDGGHDRPPLLWYALPRHRSASRGAVNSREFVWMRKCGSAPEERRIRDVRQRRRRCRL
jgi:hypothetical protein